jgi:hypothetical protein
MDFGGREPALDIADEMLAVDEAAIVADVATDPVDEAYVRGVEDGKAAVEAEIVARLDEQKERFERDLAASRESSCLEQGARIAEQLQAAIGDMEGHYHSTERVSDLGSRFGPGHSRVARPCRVGGQSPDHWRSLAPKICSQVRELGWSGATP